MIDTAADAAAAGHDLAPTGEIRAAINHGNSVLAQRDPDGTLRGVAVDLARELGRQLSLPVRLLPYDAAGKVVAALDRGAWDVAFLAIDPARAQQIVFTAPYLLIEASFMVAEGSAVQRGEDLDRSGHRIGVGAGSAYELHLSRTLKQATLERRATALEAIELLAAGEVDAVAGVRQVIERHAREHGRLRVLQPSFMAIEQALALPLGRPTGARWASRFVERMKASGFVGSALAASGQSDAVVAPARPPQIH